MITRYNEHPSRVLTAEVIHKLVEEAGSQVEVGPSPGPRLTLHPGLRGQPRPVRLQVHAGEERGEDHARVPGDHDRLPGLPILLVSSSSYIVKALLLAV